MNIQDNSDNNLTGSSNTFLNLTAPLLRYTDNTTNYMNNRIQQNLFQDSLDNILQESFEISKSPYIQVVSDEGLTMLNDISYNKNEHTQKECCITGISFEENQTVSLLPCNHIFTKEAIYKWLSKHSNECPICRYSLPSQEIKDNNNDETTQNSETQNQVQQSFFQNNHPIISPFSHLMNRRTIIPHSYIENLIIEQNENDENYILQQALLNSFER